MIRYSNEQWDELKFKSFQYEVEKRDHQWVDVILAVETEEGTPLPLELNDFKIMAICTHQGHPLQLVTLDEDCDSEYQLTEWEKDQINEFIRSEPVQQAIINAALTVE